MNTDRDPELPASYPSKISKNPTHHKAIKPPHLTKDERKELIHKYHPSHQNNLMAAIPFGPNSGELAPTELVDLLTSESHISQKEAEGLRTTADVDVLVIGGGGAGLVAARAAKREGASVLVATKLRLGDSNTCMANGISAAIGNYDSTTLHFLDTLIGGNYDGNPHLIRTLVEEASQSINQLQELGIPVKWSNQKSFGHDKTFGGHSVERGVKALLGATGVEIIRALKREIEELNIKVLESHPIIECLKDQDGKCSGAILMNLDTSKPILIHAKSVIMATGGLGSLNCGRAITSNHYGSTGDGIIVSYRLGSKLINIDSLQFHPTGVAWPEACTGMLISEHFRHLGARLINSCGDRFINETDYRDAVSSAIFRECAEGRGITTSSGIKAVWLDATNLHGDSDNMKSPTIIDTHSKLQKKGVDIFHEPFLVCPSLHYQNGGIEITSTCQTSVLGLFAAGEVAGGIHGSNRLGGNALLDVLVFGNRAGISAAKYAVTAKRCKLNLDHIRNTPINKHRPRKSPLLFPRQSKITI